MSSSAFSSTLQVLGSGILVIICCRGADRLCSRTGTITSSLQSAIGDSEREAGDGSDDADIKALEAELQGIEAEISALESMLEVRQEDTAASRAQGAAEGPASALGGAVSRPSKRTNDGTQSAASNSEAQRSAAPAAIRAKSVGVQPQVVKAAEESFTKSTFARAYLQYKGKKA